MKGIFHEGPTIEPLFQMYLTARRLAALVACSEGAICTLVVCDSRYNERQGKFPHIEAVKDRG